MISAQPAFRGITISTHLAHNLGDVSEQNLDSVVNSITKKLQFTLLVPEIAKLY